MRVIFLIVMEYVEGQLVGLLLSREGAYGPSVQVAVDRQ